ncbi:hypothetical protein EJ110_NYTH20371 [Nymphaea thermarum]|nr:hypothetical protein EJ110_NYTH20371 [Nymphaea thermarum]
MKSQRETDVNTGLIPGDKPCWFPPRGAVVLTLFCYAFFLLMWNYKHRPCSPPQIDTKLSLVDSAEAEDLNKEFDPIHHLE